MQLWKVNKLIDLKQWTDAPENNPKGQKFRNVSDRRKFVKALGLKIVKHPKTGNECVPVLADTLMLTGHRKDITRTREEEFDDKNSAKESLKKHSSDYQVQTNTRVSRLCCFDP